MNKISELCECQVDQLTPIGVKETMKYFKPSENDTWKCQVIKELLGVKEKTMTLDGFDEAEVEEMIKFLCIS